MNADMLSSTRIERDGASDGLSSHKLHINQLYIPYTLSIYTLYLIPVIYYTYMVNFLAAVMSINEVVNTIIHYNLLLCMRVKSGVRVNDCHSSG